MYMIKKRILLVDDEPSITRGIKLNLETTGQYEVQTENFAANAYSTACRFKPDLILLDVMMPGKDGGEVAAQMKTSTSLKHVPIVFLTAIVSKSETGGGASTIGSMPFLAKPVEWHKLLTCIEEHIGN